jgi:hypothetical protein
LVCNKEVDLPGDVTVKLPVRDHHLPAILRNLIDTYLKTNIPSYLEYLHRKNNIPSLSYDQAQDVQAELDAERDLMGYDDMPLQLEDVNRFLEKQIPHMQYKALQAIWEESKETVNMSRFEVPSYLRGLDLLSKVKKVVDDEQKMLKSTGAWDEIERQGRQGKGKMSFGTPAIYGYSSEEMSEAHSAESKKDSKKSKGTSGGQSQSTPAATGGATSTGGGAASSGTGGGGTSSGTGAKRGERPFFTNWWLFKDNLYVSKDGLACPLVGEYPFDKSGVWVCVDKHEPMRRYTATADACPKCTKATNEKDWASAHNPRCWMKGVCHKCNMYGHVAANCLHTN